MREIVFTCDLCGEKKPEAEMIGYEIKDGRLNLLPKKDDTRGSEKHICRTCCARIRTTKV